MASSPGHDVLRWWCRRFDPEHAWSVRNASENSKSIIIPIDRERERDRHALVACAKQIYIERDATPHAVLKHRTNLALKRPSLHYFPALHPNRAIEREGTIKGHDFYMPKAEEKKKALLLKVSHVPLFFHRFLIAICLKIQHVLRY